MKLLGKMMIASMLATVMNERTYYSGDSLRGREASPELQSANAKIEAARKREQEKHKQRNDK
jgi:hypothetical protein